jgi:hypothetical protein
VNIRGASKMPDGARGPWPAQAVDAHGERAVVARLIDDALLLEHAAGVSVVELSALTGIEVTGASVTLWHVDAGPLVLAAAGGASEIVRAVARVACQVPELTAGLRALGSPRALPGSDHDLFFAPLLSARRAAHAADEPPGRLDAFDATAIARAMDEALVAFSGARHPRSAPDQRALLEELRERCDPLWHALRRVDAAAEAVRADPGKERFRRWHEWLVAVRNAFERADDGWQASLPALADSRGRSGRLWRRVIRSGGDR